MLQRGMKFVRKLVARSAHAAALGTASLDHELRNHSMEDQTVVERPLFFLAGLFIGELFRSFGKPQEIRYPHRRFFFKLAPDYISLCSFHFISGSYPPSH